MAELTRDQVEQLAIVMKWLHSQGFTLDMVKRAAEAWWSTEPSNAGARLPDGAQPVAWRYPIGGGRYAATTNEADARSASTDGTVDALGIIPSGVKETPNG